MTDPNAPYAGHAPVTNLFNQAVDKVPAVIHGTEDAASSIWNRFSNKTSPEAREWITGGLVFLCSWLFMKDAQDSGFKSLFKFAFAGLLAVVAANYMGNHDAAKPGQDFANLNPGTVNTASYPDYPSGEQRLHNHFRNHAGPEGMQVMPPPNQAEWSRQFPGMVPPGTML